MFKRPLFFLLSTCLIFAAKAQKTMPIGAIPTHYNGGFAGEAGVPRLSSFSNLSWSKFAAVGPHGPFSDTHSRLSNFISYDNFYKKIRTGIAVTLSQRHYRYSHDGSAAPPGDDWTARIDISPKLSINGKYTIAPFADFYIWGSGHRTRYLGGFGDAGILFNSRKGYIGFSTPVFSKTFVSPYDLDSEYTFQISCQAGYTFQKTPESKFSFTPQVVLSYSKYEAPTWIFKSDSKLEIKALSLMCRYQKIVFGVEGGRDNGLVYSDNYYGKVRLPATPGFALGYQNEKIKIVLNQGFNTSDPTKFYSASLRMRYTFGNASQKF